MIKAVKKLKLWSRKKRKRRPHPPPPPYDPPPPPPARHQCHCCCSYTASSSTTQPSAPPLPPWMDYTEPTHEIETLPVPELRHPAPELAYHPLPVPVQQESTSALNLNTSQTSSYQQYMVPIPDPVHGVPVAQAPTAARERSAGFFGCVVDFGTHLFHCLFPCFHIREVIK
ncbi:hypothetical protein M0R45_025970 [Rubus argutus]|uniref:Uncharacterized protein n=1 Tax=Rubus argutus TaxID=59490 RepID=A0AAW1WXX3_RUBAR